MRCALALMALLAAVAPAAGQQPAPVQQSAPAASTPVERLQALNALSGTLVKTAQSARGAATEFRIDVAHYRETLRELMKEDASRPEQERLPRPLLMDMVRMTALLQSAAQCQTGRYIVCPADLMDSLLRQQEQVEGALAALAAGTP